MTNKNKSDFTTYRESVADDGTSASVNRTTDVDGHIRKVEVSAGDSITVELTVGGDVVASYIGEDIEKGSFDEPIVEVGANENVSLEQISGSNPGALNLVIDEYKG